MYIINSTDGIRERQAVVQLDVGFNYAFYKLLCLLTIQSKFLPTETIQYNYRPSKVLRVFAVTKPTCK